MWDISNSPPWAPCSHLKGSSASWQIAALASANAMAKKTKSIVPPAIMQVITEDQNNCHVATPAAVTMPYASRHVAKCLAHTSPGREHNRLHQAHPTIRLASPSLNHALGAQTMVVDGMEHIPVQVCPLRAQCSSINAETQTNINLTQIPGHIPWCRQIFGSFSPYLLWWHRTFHCQTWV